MQNEKWKIADVVQFTFSFLIFHFALI